MIDFRSAISIAEIIIYVPSFFFAIWLASRHGFGKNAGWYFVIVFALIRTIGAACQLATINNHSSGVLIAAIICSSIGLAPLLLAASGLLSRVNDNVVGTSGGLVSPIVFKGVSILSLVGLVLGIIGGTKINIDTLPVKLPVESKVAIIIFVVIWVIVCALLVFLALNMSRVLDGEKRILLAVAISIPLLLSRLIYAVIADFGHSAHFSLYNGSAAINLGMAVVEEFIITIVFLAIGSTLRIIPKATRTTTTGDRYGQHQSTKNDVETGTAGPTGQNFHDAPPSTRPQRRPIRGGPISMLYKYGMNLYDDRRAR